VPVRNFMVGDYGSLTNDGKLVMGGITPGWEVPQTPFMVKCAVAIEFEDEPVGSHTGVLSVHGPIQPIEPMEFQIDIPDGGFGGMLFPSISFVLTEAGSIVWELSFNEKKVLERYMDVRLIKGTMNDE